MNNQAIVFSLSVLLWIFLAYRFFRALKNRKVTNGTSLHAWAIYFLCYLIAALTVDTIETRIDTLFAGMPVTVFVRSLLMLATAYVFFWGIRSVAPGGERLKRAIVILNVVTVIACIAVFAWFVSSRLISTGQVIYLIKDIRDVMMILWAAFIFIPTSRHIWRDEHIRPMKLHRALELIFFGSFLIESGTGVALSLPVVITSTLEPSVWTLDRSFTYLCYVLILVMLVPYRWLMPLFYPKQLLLYLRLRRLQGEVKGLSSTTPPLPTLSLNLSHPDEIELAIYQMVIAILDMYPSIGERGHILREQIQRVVQTQPQYTELVQRMSEIRV